MLFDSVYYTSQMESINELFQLFNNIFASNDAVETLIAQFVKANMNKHQTHDLFENISSSVIYGFDLSFVALTRIVYHCNRNNYKLSAECKQHNNSIVHCLFQKLALFEISIKSFAERHGYPKIRDENRVLFKAHYKLLHNDLLDFFDCCEPDTTVFPKVIDYIEKSIKHCYILLVELSELTECKIIDGCTPWWLENAKTFMIEQFKILYIDFMHQLRIFRDEIILRVSLTEVDENTLLCIDTNNTTALSYYRNYYEQTITTYDRKVKD